MNAFHTSDVRLCMRVGGGIVSLQKCYLNYMDFFFWFVVVVVPVNFICSVLTRGLCGGSNGS